MSSDTPSALREELLQLDTQRDAVMKKTEEAIAFLATTPVGLDGSLVDEEGFPRDDCDLYAVRHARHTVNCGRNDLKTIEAAMYEKLAQLHEANHEEAHRQMQEDEAARSSARAATAALEQQQQQQKRSVAGKPPFVRVVSAAA
ncbi:proteasome 26S non-ATPase subunit 9, partial [Trypanosoma grayi]|uniref:proteasome 26S non-ATPase subunit 9 n=1 Tax=Trypanosoma grayi TaxID=71804 RepID=UPI0004F4BB13